MEPILSREEIADLLAAVKAGRIPAEQPAGGRPARPGRTLPTRVTQRLQVMAQNRFAQPVLRSTQPLQPPWALRMFGRTPLLQRIPARIVGVGVRPEHVQSPQAPPA